MKLNNGLQKMFDKVEKEWKKPPKVRIIAQQPEDKQKAEIMQKVLEYQWAENWPIVRADIESRMRVMIQKCYLIGNHDWIGFGEKGRHICRRCGLRAGMAYDPIFNGFAQIFWNKDSSAKGK
jgi:hypothetical protein